ncbi:MAG: hypothetical protein H0X50_00445 [Nitrosopumilus sp.]|nr:hypothetical protein [Nitrosopumilus sp.]
MLYDNIVATIGNQFRPEDKEKDTLKKTNAVNKHTVYKKNSFATPKLIRFGLKNKPI